MNRLRAFATPITASAAAAAVAAACSPTFSAPALSGFVCLGNRFQMHMQPLGHHGFSPRSKDYFNIRDLSHYGKARSFYSRSLGKRRLSSRGREIGMDNEVVSSVRTSLRRDLVEPHLAQISTFLKNTSKFSDSDGKGGNIDPPTLVLVLAVSGGCDSVALFHSVINLLEPADCIHQKTGSTTLLYASRWLYLGDEERNLEYRHAKLDARGIANDSTATLKIPCEVHVAHFNHEQRGENSDGDEVFVRDLCRDHGIPFHSYSWSDMESEPPKNPGSSMSAEEAVENNIISTVEYDETSFTQDVARDWRQKKLKQLLADLVIPTKNEGVSASQRWGSILTAHHRDDADETILLKLLRGSHLTNMRGMEPCSDSFDLRYYTSNDGKHDTSQIDELPFVGYFAKPLLGVRKSQVLDFLNLHSHKWREDESNQSNKYKRNKIRNQLMPLLCEIAGGERALQKRFSNLEQQSQDISRDLTKRAEDYLVSTQCNSLFLLSSVGDDPTVSFDLVQEEALHLWVVRSTNRELQLSYEKMLQIREQIHLFPERLQWTLDVGDSWKIRRNGYSLAVLRNGIRGSIENDSADKQHNPWKIIRIEPEVLQSTPLPEVATHNHDRIELFFKALSSITDASEVLVQRVKDCRNLKFVPPWRKGRSAVKIREFLRGQKVPLHCRDDTFILCSSVTSSNNILAVLIEDMNETGDGKWVIHADLIPENESTATKITLGRISYSSQSS